MSQSEGDDVHNDSDTIVISTHSRILISPRKKGSNAVRDLLTADDGNAIVNLLTSKSKERQNVVVGHKKTSTQVKGGAKKERVEFVYDSDDDEIPLTPPRPTQQRSDLKNNRTEFKQSGETHTTKRIMGSKSTKTNVHIDSKLSCSDSEHGGGMFSQPSDQDEEIIQSLPTSVKETTRSLQRQTSKEDTANKMYRPVAARDSISAKAMIAKKKAKHSTRKRHTRMKPISHLSEEDEEDSENENAGSDRGNSTSVHFAAQERGRRPAFDDHLGSSHSSQQSSDHVVDNSLNDSVIIPPVSHDMKELKHSLQKLAQDDRKKRVTDSSENVKERKNAGTTSGFIHSEAALASVTNKRQDRRDRVTKEAHKSKSRDYYHEESEEAEQEEDEGVSSTSSISSESARVTKSRTAFTTPPRTTRTVRRSTNITNALRSDSTTTSPHTRQVSSPSLPLPVSSVTRTSPSPLTAGSHTTSYKSILDTSFGSTTSTYATNTSSQGSRAVLSALKALQDKIKRLEQERETLMQELSDTKVHARKKEAEAASKEKQLTYELSQSKESARAAYDSVRSEKEELKLELVKYAERRKAMETELEHARKLAATYSSNVDDLKNQLEISESQNKNLHQELHTLTTTKSQDWKSTMMTLEKERDTLKEQNQMLTAQFERESTTHAETRERLREAEQTIVAITQLNEKLVAKVWEANEYVDQVKKKKKQQTKLSTLTRPTAASRAASFTGPKTPRSEKRTSIKSSVSTTKKKQGSSTNLELLRAANLGRDIPFVLGTSSNRSHSIISNVQDAIRQCDTMYSTTDPRRDMTSPRGSDKPRKKRSILKIDTDQARNYIDNVASASASILGMNPPSTQKSTLITRRRSKDVKASSPHNIKTNVIRVPTPSAVYPSEMKSQIMEDLETVVKNAETDYAQLKDKYDNTVTRIESGASGSAQLSLSLAPMLDELEAKKKQLKLLKQVWDQAEHSTINPNRRLVHSPEAVMRKTASLRILNDYRQLERDAKSPRSVTDAVSPRGLSRRTSFFSDEE